MSERTTIMKNENRSGYKKTKVGWIPESWECDLVESHSKRGSGHTPNKQIDEYYDGSIVWISLADSKNLDNGIVSSSKITISEEGIKNSSAVLHPEGTVFISRDAGVGKSGIAGCDLCVSQHFIAWTCHKESLNNWFLYHYLQYTKREFERIAVGSTIKTIGLPYFKKYKIPIPPLPEQEAIAEVLECWDAGIRSMEKKIELKRNIKKGLMQKLLSGQSRLAGFSGEWKAVKLGDIATITMGQSPKSSSYNSDNIGIPLVQGNADIKNRKTVPRNWTTAPTKKCNSGDLILSVRAPIGMIAKSMHDACVGRGVCGIKSNSLSNIDFLYFLLLREEEQWDSIGQGSTFSAINGNDIKNKQFHIPQIDEQQAIAEVLTDADVEISTQEAKLARWKDQKKYLLNELVTGSIRVGAASNHP
jgi:type I restriction enzyme S subunit